ncbi:hypothetical protein BofuT4_uP159080.1 [Botrytis cinerea T4]|uniref:Uncharacterized protein n=1 Tax=Botryotinia fuckeliana (strain T4) TaxID=999810 RepID=G2YTY9_BOTF4|nr:hypothetical protein BofuT4_uP159080.1 [Botrytis cinerea T4]
MLSNATQHLNLNKAEDEQSQRMKCPLPLEDDRDSLFQSSFTSRKEEFLGAKNHGHTAPIRTSRASLGLRLLAGLTSYCT